MDESNITSRLGTLMTGRMMVLSTMIEQECKESLRSIGLERGEQLEK